MNREFSESDWVAQGSLIANLYLTQGMTADQVCQVLRENGFDVRLRTLRNKIHSWKLDKNHKSNEMRTALYVLTQLGYNGRNWPSEELRFFIRGRLVTLKDVIRYYRRKNIYDPFAWLATQLPDGFQPCPDVMLTPESNTGQISNSFTSSRADNPSFLSYPAATSPRNPDPAIESTQSASYHSNMLTLPSDSPYAAVGSPLQFRRTEQMVWLAASYCSSYLDSIGGVAHLEPIVHQDTVHGCFGHKIQDGISAILYQNESSRAFAHFGNAFDMLWSLLKDNHPMSLAQLFAVVCELAIRAAMPAKSPIEGNKQIVLSKVLKVLIEHIAKLSAERLQTSHPITAMFDVLSNAEQPSDQVVRIMQSMVNSFAQAELLKSNLSYWKLLYLKERYCDCLYYTGMNGTRQSLRAQLLNEQERYYGKTARNVLWTLTNVADDYLYNARPSDAESAFEDALLRAESLEGFAKAKIRFAALEGLAKSAQWKADVELARAKLDWCATSNSTSATSSADSRRKLLYSAERFCEQAEAEARKWFGWNSRRTIWIAKKRLEIADELQKMALEEDTLVLE